VQELLIGLLSSTHQNLSKRRNSLIERGWISHLLADKLLPQVRIREDPAFLAGTFTRYLGQ
jgi:hypothetical protein